MQKLIVTLSKTKKSPITVIAMLMAMVSIGLLVSCDSSTSSETTPEVEITATAVPSEAGEITPKVQKVEQGSSVEISATQNYGWVFSHWEGDYQGPSNPFSYVAEQDAKFLAIFEKSDFSLTVEIEGEGDVRQSVKRYKTTSYEYNTEVVLAAEPETSWRFVRWEGDLTGNENNAYILVNEPKTVTAVFEKRDYPLRIIVEGSGAIAEEVKTAKTTNYAFGSMVELTAQPADDWQFDRWERDLSGSENPQTITIDEAKTVKAVFITTPNLRTKPASDVTTNRVFTGGAFYDDGGSEIKERGVCWSENSTPTTDDNCTSDGDGLGEFESEITDLDHSTTYHIRAFAINSVGPGYGGELEFKTDEIFVPTIETEPVTDISETSAVSGGNIIDDGGSGVTYRGVCWSEITNPNIQDNKCTSDGEGLGRFQSEIADLDPSTTYYIRAIAINSVGSGYGDELEFTTMQEQSIATVTTKDITSITTNSAKSGGEVTNNGNSTVTEKGVCWSESGSPTIDDNCTSEGVGIGEFESTITGLNPDKEYLVRAYATNVQGTGYGDEKTFTTESDDWPRDTETKVVDVTNPATGQTWMDRNLGASRAATSRTDSEAYGDLYQWGRAADGHQKRNSGTTSTLSSTNTPGHGDFITSSSEANWDWRNPQNNILWQGVDGINNPCPDGYRLPTVAEWEVERQSWSKNDRDGAFESPLKLPAALSRFGSSGSLFDVGSFGEYWSSSVLFPQSRTLDFGSNYARKYSSFRGYGYSVRCIKD